MEKIDSVIFDLDDTLLDRTKTFSLYCDYFIKKYLPKDISNRDKIKIEIINFDKNGYENRKIFYDKIIKKWKLKDKITELENDWMENFNKFVVPEENMIEVLEYLKKYYKLGIITNGSSIMQNNKINSLRIRNYFKDIIISEDIGLKKPDKNIFLIACSNLKTIPSHAIYVGDNFNIDILGAINAGLKGIWINKFKQPNDYENTIEKIEDLKNKL